MNSSAEKTRTTLGIRIIESESEGEEDELLPIERKSRKMDAEKAKKTSESRLEQLQVNVRDEETYQLPSSSSSESSDEGDDDTRTTNVEKNRLRRRKAFQI